jgi:hypothetical protein
MIEFKEIETRVIAKQTRSNLQPKFNPNLDRGEPLAGREATTPSIIIRKGEVQRREEMPPNGALSLPKIFRCNHSFLKSSSILS